MKRIPVLVSAVVRAAATITCGKDAPTNIFPKRHENNERERG
jgi:hypothetical protein